MIRKNCLSVVVCLCGALLLACGVGCQSAGSDSGGLKNPFTSKKSQQAAAEKEITEKLAEGNRSMGSRRYHEARGHYLRVIEIYEETPGIKKNPLPYCQMGIISEELKMYPEAEDYYKKAIALDKTQAEPYNSLGYCMYRQQKHEEAIQWLEKAVELKPAGAKYLNNLGLVYGSKGDYPKAFQYFRLAGTEADAYYNMSTIFAMQGKDEEARQSLMRAVQLNPGHKDAERMLIAYEESEADAALFDSPKDFYDYQKRGFVEYRDDGGLGAPNVEPMTAGYTRQYGNSHQNSAAGLMPGGG